MQLNPTAFNAWLANIGQDFLWRKGYACPCVNPLSGAADKDCQICIGRGRYWAAAVQGKAGVASQRVQQQWAQFGLWQQGDTVLSLPSDSPLYGMGQFDRVQALNAFGAFSAVFFRGTKDKLEFAWKSIDRVFWLDANHTTVIEGASPLIDSDGNMTWIAGGPPIGTQYSVSGYRYNEYYCFMDDPNDRNEHAGRPLPRRVVLRTFDIFGR